MTLSQPSTTQMPRRTYDIMGLLHVWNSILFLLTAVRITGSTFNGTEKDILHAIAGNPFMLRTWSMIDSTLFITMKKDNNTILDFSKDAPTDKNVTVQNSRIMLVYNQTIQELCLLFENVSKEDGGIYEIKESFYITNTNPDVAVAHDDTYDRKDGTWYLEIYVLGPGETKQGYVGGNISMEFAMSAQHSTLYNYDKLGALLAGSTGSVVTDSSLYGRLNCANDDSGGMYKITIVNVSQSDAGLYKLATGRDETGKCFFSIEDSPACAVVGENMTIGWFYNQQGIKRTLRVIHPNQGVMMLVHQTNSPQIKSNFQHRLIYNGDILQSFMSFTVRNVRHSDAGLYTIETVHGNPIPGSKKLNVEGTCTIGGRIQTTFHDVTTNISDTKQEVVTTELTERQCVPVFIVTPVFIVAAVVSIAIIAMTGCLIWIQRRNSYKLEAVKKRLDGEKCEAMLLATPSMRRHLYKSHLAEGWGSRLTPSNDLRHHPNAAIPSESGVVDTTLYSTFLQSDVEDDNHGVSCIADHNGLSTMNDGEILIACVKHSEESNLGSYPSVYSLAKAAAGVEYGYNCIVEGMGTRHESHNIQPFHGKDTVTRRTDGLCKNEYEMMDIEVAFDPDKTFEDYSKYSESSKYQTPLCHGQRRVLDKCETASFVTISTIRRPPSMSPSGDTWSHGQVPERKAFSNAMLSFPVRAISTVSASLNNTYCSTEPLSEPDDDKPSIYFITNPNYTIGRTDEKTLVSCDRAAHDDVLDSCAPTCTLGSASRCEEHIYKCILNGNGSSQMSQSIQSLYTQIKKGPNVASRHTTTIDSCVAMGGTDSPLCRTEYEMVNISTDFDQEQTVQDDSVGCESAEGHIPLCNG